MNAIHDATEIELTQKRNQSVNGKDAGILAFSLLVLILSTAWAVKVGFQGNITQHGLSHAREDIAEVKEAIRKLEAKK